MSHLCNTITFQQIPLGPSVTHGPGPACARKPMPPYQPSADRQYEIPTTGSKRLPPARLDSGEDRA